jgi:hypothetical protein
VKCSVARARMRRNIVLQSHPEFNAIGSIMSHCDVVE